MEYGKQNTVHTTMEARKRYTMLKKRTLWAVDLGVSSFFRNLKYIFGFTTS
jgi:hypothetical protein